MLVVFYTAVVVLFVACMILCVALWNALAWPRVGDSKIKKLAASSSVSILIPARDEEANIADCLDAALAQKEFVREVLVYDDHSTDRTGEIVAEYARRDERVRLVAHVPLPAGWCGKTFACAQLAEAARGHWLLFLDADARLNETAVAHIIHEAEARGVSLLSCWPRLEMRGFWEGTLMPLLNFVVFTLYPAPLALRRRTDSSLGLAHGSCILARRDDYEFVGGHAAVRGELFEDVRLAQLWRARGRLSLCLDGQRVIGVRMYCSLPEIWRGFQKNFFPAFRNATSFWAFVALHFFVFLLPFALLPFVFLATGITWAFAAAALCVIASRVVLALRFKHPWWSALLHPLGEIILIALGVSSWLRCRTGRGVVWKGRRYRAGAEAAGEAHGRRVIAKADTE